MCPRIFIPMNNINIEDSNVSDNEDNLHIIPDSPIRIPQTEKI